MQARRETQGLCLSLLDFDSASAGFLEFNDVACVLLFLLAQMRGSMWMPLMAVCYAW